MPFSKIIKAYDLHSSVSTDTRKIRNGDIFFALKGDHFNGNKYAAQALEMGASLAVIDEAAFLPEDASRYALVSDVLLALQDLARHYRKKFSIPVIAITGTNGKTTTKELMHAALSTEKRVHATAGNLNNHIGVPLTILSMPLNTQIAIIEMGANKSGDIKELVEIALPTHGLITNIGRAHLERFGDVKGVQKTKGELFDYLRNAEACIFLNLADERVVAVAENIACCVTYGSTAADTEVIAVDHLEAGMRISIGRETERNVAVFPTQLIGDHNIENVLAAVTVAWEMAVSTAAIQQGIADYQPRMNRTQLIPWDGKTILLDAYNANPSSMEAAVRTVGQQARGQAALVLGDMFELGPESLKIHCELIRYVKQMLPDATLIGIGKDMQAAILAEAPAQKHYLNTAEASPHILADLAEMDFVLIKGSRGMALEKLLPYLGIEI